MFKKNALLAFAFITVFNIKSISQNDAYPEGFTLSDTLQGSINKNRDWWDVQRYDITVKPSFIEKSIEAKCIISFTTLRQETSMQIDLKQPLIIDSIRLFPKNLKISTYTRNGNIYLIDLPLLKLKSHSQLHIYYHGIPKEAINPPWDGGWIWKKDDLGNPWMGVACQDDGASIWYPCKDHQSDEPDKGASLTMIIPDTLKGISNGKLVSESKQNGLITMKWNIQNPINSYDLVPYIGKYVNFKDTLHGEAGTLPLDYWVLIQNVEKAKKQFKQVKPMLHCFEHWFGKYPFYEDSYKLVEASYVGMENQSGIAYGNGYANGYTRKDLSGTSWGLKWDFIIIHESGHEWFGNNITTADMADMWVHEGFTNYSEVLYTEWLFGKEAGIDYCNGIRKNIKNDKPIIAPYGVHKQGSGDMYYKAANMIHIIRINLHNDSLFRDLLRGMNKNFYHKIVTSKQIEEHIILKTKLDLRSTFQQYLTTTQIPRLVCKKNNLEKTITVNWENCIEEFNMPITIITTGKKLTITPLPQQFQLNEDEYNWLNKFNLERNYYVHSSISNNE